MRGFRSKHGARSDEEEFEPIEGMVHAHAYFYWPEGTGFTGTTGDAFKFLDTKPRVDTCNENRPAYFRQAAMHGIWYVWVRKKGTLESAANCFPFRDFMPQGKWLRSLWTWGKLDHDEYMEMSCKIREGHPTRKRECMEVQGDESEFLVKVEKLKARQDVYSQMPPLTSFYPAETAHKLQFRDKKVRYKALVYDGPSGTGKSVRGALLYDPKTVFIVDCQNAAVPDLRGLSRHKHSCVVLDEVPGVDFALNNKKLLMSHIDGCKLGQSATQMFAYNIWWWKKPVIMTSNHWKSSFEEASPEDQDWLRKNVLYVRLETVLMT